VIEHFLKGRRVRVAGVLDDVAVGCREDLAAIYRDYWPLVYKRCQATLLDHEAAQDATQDVFLQALKSFEDIQHDIVRGLLDLARTISYERKRRPTREIPLADPPRNGSSGDDPAEIAERHRVLDDVWSGLSQVERRYLADKFAGFSFEEIARRNRRALGTVSSNLARAREHARKMREPMLPAFLGLAGRRLTDLSRRARSAAHSSSLGVVAQPVGSLTLSLTVAGLLVGVVPAATAAPALALAPQARGVTVAAPGLAGGAPGMVANATTAPRGVAMSASTTTSHRSSSALPALLPTGSASSETPEDTDIVAATASPDYSQDHTIVALGHGNACNCPTLLMSTDGGSTWRAAAGPPAGDQIVLSPTFPADPTIYVGYTTAPTTFSNYWTPRFGDGFQILRGVPAGTLTLPAGFDRGDDRIIVSTTSGTWSATPGAGLPQPMLIETGKATPSVATAFDAVGAGVLAITTTAAVSPDQTVNPDAIQSGETLWNCPPTSGCRRAAGLPLTSGARLAISPAFAADQTVAAFTSGELLASTDGGARFDAVDLPWPGASIVDLELSPSARGANLWATISRAGGWALMRLDTWGGWREADGGNATIIGNGGRTVVLSAQSLLFLPAHGGLLCTVNGGVTWEARCPSA
jgi:RNA polymerase sigma factor (sigma-70 family)